MIHNLVYLIRENSQKSEQTYSVDLTVGDPGGNTNPAIIETFDNYDYSFGFPEQTKQNIRFPPTVDRISFVFSLNPNLSVEETEIFCTSYTLWSLSSFSNSSWCNCFCYYTYSYLR